MAEVVYHIVEHDGGWAYRVDGTYSETFRTRQDAHTAAERAAAEQRVAGDTAGIRYETADGTWKDEIADGGDRPQTKVDD